VTIWSKKGLAAGEREKDFDRLGYDDDGRGRSRRKPGPTIFLKNDVITMGHYNIEALL
jgi:hypothetical protein